MTPRFHQGFEFTLFRTYFIHFYIIRISKREDGGTGRRARLRIWWGNLWGFESPFSHYESNKRNHLVKEELTFENNRF